MSSVFIMQVVASASTGEEDNVIYIPEPEGKSPVLQKNEQCFEHAGGRECQHRGAQRGLHNWLCRPGISPCGTPSSPVVV